MNLENIIYELNLTAQCEAYYPLSASDYVDFVIITLSVFTFAFSLISWIKLTDFRSFKNYLFIYVIINNIVNAILRNLNFVCVADKYNDPVTVITVLLIAQGFHIYFGLTADYWLMLLFYDTYLNVVKIYNNHIVRRYLKANLWGWGMPLLISLFTYLIIPALVPAHDIFIILLKNTFILVPLVFNGVIYLIIFFSMLKTKIVSTIGEKKCRYLRMLTFLFMLCILPLSSHIMAMFRSDKWSLQIIKLLYSLNDLTVILYFLTGSHNMALWKEYYGKNQSKRLLDTYF